MQKSISRPADNYSPLYFLVSLGTGGLTVTFFMWLMHWIPHPGRSVPVFEDILQAFGSGDFIIRGMILSAVAGILYYAFLNLKYLFWNLINFRRWKKTEAYSQLYAGNAETQLMALPLALAMTVNVLFVLGMVLMPGLWSVVEYLFPPAIIVFLLIGILAFRQFGNFLGRVLTQGGFLCAGNNSFAQALPAFALAMVGVGLAAPAGLSDVALVAGVGLVFSTFFFVSAVLIAVIALFLGFRALLEQGANIETAPTLSIFIPVLTILGILGLRQSHGLNEHFALVSSAADRLMTLSQFLSAQLLFALLTGLVLIRLGYFGRFILGREASVGSYALVCPGVALVVMIQFWLNRGMVDAQLLTKFSVAYWVLTAFALALQAATMWLVAKLNGKHFKIAGSRKGKIESSKA